MFADKKCHPQSHFHPLTTNKKCNTIPLTLILQAQTFSSLSLTKVLSKCSIVKQFTQILGHASPYHRLEKIL